MEKELADERNPTIKRNATKYATLFRKEDYEVRFYCFELLNLF